jgi:hypothetical protein
MRGRSLYSLTPQLPAWFKSGREEGFPFIMYKIEILIEAWQEPVLSDPQLPAWFKSEMERGFPSIIEIILGFYRGVAGACTL